jgi:acyl-CoA synthetase (AMP-forming)/AMP-acid ligase II
MFRMQWNLPEFGAYDLSSLEFVVYGGSSVDNGFLKKMAAMAPRFGTGLGATENAGFGTFTPQGISIEEMAGQVGQAYDDLAKISIREPMNADGTAGIALPDHAVGEICYHPPIVFLGYFDQPEATASAISKEGILYTGDLGCFKPMDGYRALYLAGRRKFVIKQKGYNVFPGEVEEYLAGMAGVEMAEVVGMKHELFDEGIFAFVQPKAGVEITSADVMAHCKGIAAYKRPAHVEIWPSDREFPLTRSTKVDKMGLTGIAAPIIQSLREKGLWDAGTLGSV